MNILDDGVNEENGNLPPDCTQEDDFVVPEPSFSQTAILQVCMLSLVHYFVYNFQHTPKKSRTKITH